MTSEAVCGRWYALKACDVSCGMQVRSGVRAVPKHTNEGAPPLVGRIPRNDSGSMQSCGWWLVTGLGVRGLLYHALMAEYLVHAIRSGDESHIPKPLRRWQ